MILQYSGFNPKADANYADLFVSLKEVTNFHSSPSTANFNSKQ